MVSLRERLFFISGADFLQRQRIIENIKKRILERDTSINTLTLYCNDIDLKDLKEEVLTVSFGKKRLVIFKDFLKLTKELRNFIFNNFNKILVNTYFIFETEEDSYSLRRNRKFINDNFFKAIFEKASSFKTASSGRDKSIEDFMNSIKRNDFISSLDILENLFQEGARDRELGPQIIGILNKHFSYLKDSYRKKQYFNYLWEADRSLKERGLNSRLVIEVLLVRFLNLN